MSRNADGTWNTKSGCPPYQFWIEQANRFGETLEQPTPENEVDGKVIEDKKHEG